VRRERHRDARRGAHVVPLVAAAAHLAGMSADPATRPEKLSWGARLAAESRQRQGLPAGVADPAVRDRLQALCGLPSIGRDSGAPDELDPASE
jgi:hypothetical protein